MPARRPPEANGKLNVFVFCIHCQRRAQGDTMLQLLNLFPVPYGSVDANVSDVADRVHVALGHVPKHGEEATLQGGLSRDISSITPAFTWRIIPVSK